MITKLLHVVPIILRGGRIALSLAHYDDCNDYAFLAC